MAKTVQPNRPTMWVLPGIRGEFAYLIDVALILGRRKKEFAKKAVEEVCVYLFDEYFDVVARKKQIPGVKQDRLMRVIVLGEGDGSSRPDDTVSFVDKARQEWLANNTGGSPNGKKGDNLVDDVKEGMMLIPWWGAVRMLQEEEVIEEGS